MNRSIAAVACLALLASGCASGRLKAQQAQIQQLQGQAQKLKSQEEAAEGRVKDKDQQLASLQGQKSDLEGKAADLAEKLNGAQAQIDSLQKSNQDLSQSMEANKGELAKKLAAVVRAKDELGRKLNEMLKEKVAAERAKANLQSAKNKLSAQAAALQRERDELSGKLGDIQARDQKSADERAARLGRVRQEIAQLSDALTKEVEADKATVVQSDERIKITLQDSLLFEPQQAKLTDGGSALLDRLGAALHALPPRGIRVEGHYDNAPMKKELFGGFASAWDLTGARAVTVARYLHEHGGLDPARLSAVGLGEFQPVQPNDGPDGREANRRIVVILDPS